MRYARLLAVLLVAAVLSTAGFTAESKPAAEKKAEAKVDKTLAKPKQEIQRFWVTPEMLIMWSKDGPVHDLYVTRTTNGSDPRLTNPAAARLFSNDDQDYGLQLGGRLTFGAWVDDGRRWGLEISGFALEENEASWTYAGSTNSTGGIPYLRTTPSGQAEEVWYINTSTGPGAVSITSNSQLWGAEGSGLYNFKRSDNMSLDFSFGVKHLDLSEDFQLSNRYDVLPGRFFSGKDRWETDNGFYGAKLGLKFNMTCWDRLLVNIEPAVSLGANCESLEISGSTHHLIGGVSTIRPGGMFTGSTNIGDYDKTKFAVVPEIKLGLGCKITKNISFNANYNFMYISDVVRPGEQFNRRINESNVGYDGGLTVPVAPFDPQPRFESTDYWAHGVGVNLKIQF